ncbi:MAG TPA: CRISPR-associated endonuclease Cas2 [Candidatus Atribacteria bacterium]|nr:CRISPR-associated endonuclease Cas2 [Candidatus Atribacteria bacterium]
MNFLIVTYDIPSDKRRNKICNILKDYGTRVQYSVFECILDDVLTSKMILRLKKQCENHTDSIRIYSLCSNCQRKIKVIGKGKISENEKFIII